MLEDEYDRLERERKQVAKIINKVGSPELKQSIYQQARFASAVDSTKMSFLYGCAFYIASLRYNRWTDSYYRKQTTFLEKIVFFAWRGQYVQAHRGILALAICVPPIIGLFQYVSPNASELESATRDISWSLSQNITPETEPARDAVCREMGENSIWFNQLLRHSMDPARNLGSIGENAIKRCKEISSSAILSFSPNASEASRPLLDEEL